MKQVIQSFKDGSLTVSDVPPPQLQPAGLLVRTAASLVSAGTERMVVDFAAKNLLQKARTRPDLVRQVLDKAQQEGIRTTLDSVRNRLEQALPLGYSSAGVVVAVGAQARGFKAGDRVACAGGGYASHAEQVYVPRTLVARLPENVSFEAAAFATVGSVALHGIRLANVEVGSPVAVIGLGLIGLLALQLLKASGCRVLGIDLNPQRIALALELGAEDACLPENAPSQAERFTGGRGVDAVLIAADTRSSDPIRLAGTIARDRATVVAVGAVGMHVPRKLYYDKELTLRVSRSYGPGRYDPDYEEGGHDYPYGYVRWTEGRNLEAFVQLVSSGRIAVEPLITHRFPIAEAARAYELITGKTGEPFLGVLLTYDTETELAPQVTLRPTLTIHTPQAALRIGLIGAGNFASSTLLPAMRSADDIDFVGIVSASGLSARQLGERFNFAYCASAPEQLYRDSGIQWIVIATRHHLHAAQTIAAIQAGKDVFVEKPLALNEDELVDVLRVQRTTGRRLMVGFNRRFAPLAQAMQRFVADHSRPLTMIYRINAGAIPRSHWTQDPAIGGGRILGEACHFIDLLQFLTGAPPVQVNAQAVRQGQTVVDDEAAITLNFADGSVGVVVYAAGGDKAYGKERIEILGDGKLAVLDNFRALERVHQGKRTVQRARWRTSKGHRETWLALAQAVQAGAATPIPIEDIAAAHLATFAAVESLRSGQPVAVDTAAFWQQVYAEQERGDVNANDA